jgi:hypothetical protein
MATSVVSCNANHVEVPFPVASKLKASRIATAVIRVDNYLESGVFLWRFVRRGARRKVDAECTTSGGHSSRTWMSFQILRVDIFHEIEVGGIVRILVTDLPPIFLVERIQYL